jgi:hypothetical protein
MASFPGNDDAGTPPPVGKYTEDPWQTGGPLGPDSISGSVSASGSPVIPVGSQLLIQEASIMDPEDVLEDDTRSQEDKAHVLQKMLFTASSNGNLEKVHDLLGGPAKDLIDINAKDENGSTALIYSSCFGKDAIVIELLRFGALADEQDKHEWTALMWAINNHHGGIVRQLVEHGASVTLTTSTGRSAIDFVSPNSEIHQYLKQNGYMESGAPHDFYREVRDPTLVEEELSRELMMDTAVNLDVNLAHLDLNDVDSGDSFSGDDEEGVSEFVWERCLPDQMFVFNHADIPRILNIAITEMEPQRSRSQKPVPANMIFLSARYAHYVCNEETLNNLLDPVLVRMRSVIIEHKQDLAFLAFWMSNCSLLLYYIRKDPGLFVATVSFQERLSELISDVHILITQDVESRLDSVLDTGILDHDTIPGLDNIAYQSEWRIFRSKGKQMTARQEVDQVTKPPSPKRKAQPSPRNVTSILSSVLFVMDLYDVHPIITQQIVSQILYWLGAVLFNRIMSNRKYLARSRAMQIRLNVSAIEDWARANNRRPEDADEFRTTVSSYPSLMEICRKHFSSLVQILQWLQCFTGFGDDFTDVVATLQQLKDLNPLQLLHVAKKYRAEVGEKGLSKEYKAYLAQLMVHYQKQHSHHATVDKPPTQRPTQRPTSENEARPVKNGAAAKNVTRDPKQAELKEGDQVQSEKEDPTPSNTEDHPEPRRDESRGEKQAESKKEDAKGGGKDVETNKEDAKKGDVKKESERNGDHRSVEEKMTEKRQPIKPSIVEHESDDDEPNKMEIYLDASVVLPFVIPTLREMIIAWGAGLGGTHKKRARRYEPSLPTEILDKFDSAKEAEDGYRENVNTSIFTNLAVPERSVHKGWGEDPMIDDLNAGW